MLTTSTIDLHWVIERSLSVWPSSNIWESGQSGQDVTQPTSSNEWLFPRQEINGFAQLRCPFGNPGEFGRSKWQHLL